MLKMIRNRARTRMAALALAGAALIGGGAVVAADVATAPAAQAASSTYYVNCGTTGWATIQVSNFYSSQRVSIAAWDAKTGVYYGTRYVNPGQTFTWYPVLRNAKFVVAGSGYSVRGTWCSY